MMASRYRIRVFSVFVYWSFSVIVFCPIARSEIQFNGDNLKAAVEYSERHKGLAVLVMHQRQIVYEHFTEGYDPNRAVHLYSATKGFWSAAAAAMLDDGWIASFDEPASETLTEWRRDRLKRWITIRHLLTLTAGLKQDIPALQGLDGYAYNKYQYAVDLELDRVPGRAFRYGPSCYYALGELMRRKLLSTGETPLDYLKRRVLDPIGCKIGDWVHDPAGNPHIPNGSYFTAREWIKYGQLLVQQGRWENQQILDPNSLAQCFLPSEVNPGHGLALWLNQPSGRGVTILQSAPPDAPAGWIYPDAYPDIIGALGAGRCRMYMVPNLKVVIVRLAEGEEGPGYQDAVFLGLILGQEL